MTQADRSFKAYHKRKLYEAARTFQRLAARLNELDPAEHRLLARAKLDVIRHDDALKSGRRGFTRYSLTPVLAGAVAELDPAFVPENLPFDQAGFEEAMASLELPATPKRPVASVEQLRQWRLEEEKRQTETALADIKERRAAVKAADDEIVGFAKLRLVKKDDQL